MIVSEDAVPPSQIDPTVPGAPKRSLCAGSAKPRGSLQRPRSSQRISRTAISPRTMPPTPTCAPSLSHFGRDRRRAADRMLIEAEREATVTGVYANFPSLNLIKRHDETVIEIEAPSNPTANFRVGAQDNTLEPAQSPP